MDSKLIDLFREKVNDNGADFVLHRYRNINGKNQWSIICSAMDWISVVVDEIDVKKLSYKNDNDSSIRVMTFIVCIDVLWEAIQQLHRVLFNTQEIPFVEEKSVFRHKLFETTDNEYFKTIRACFATHPVNLKDDFSGEKKAERRYASWSGGGFGDGDFSVILYSNQPDRESKYLNIYFSELFQFAEQRYAYLNNLIDEIDRQTMSYYDVWKNKHIRRVSSVIEQIEILIHESKMRFDNDYYNFALEELRLIYSTEIHSMQNEKLVEKYRIALIEKVNEIFAFLQDMSLKNLTSDEKINDKCPPDCHYAFSKLSDVVWGNDYRELVDFRCLQNSIESIANLSACNSPEEVYVVLKAGFFAKNSDLRRQA